MLKHTRETPSQPSVIGGIDTVTEETFDREVLELTTPVVVEFMEPSCSDSPALEQLLEQVAETTIPKLTLCRVDIAADHDLAEQYGIVSTPTLMMFLNGERMGRVDNPELTVTGVLASVTRQFRGLVTGPA